LARTVIDRTAGASATSTITETTPDVAYSLLRGASAPVLIDVREQVEWDDVHLAGAVHLPLARVSAEVAALVPHRDTPVLLYCAHGVRSHAAAEALVQRGYTQVASLAGGIAAWEVAELPVVHERHATMSSGQRERYARHLSLPGVGPEGQQRLLGATVLIVGAGGLGSPVALYLAAAGVGHMRIVDFDVVDASNLQRQVLHTTAAIGERKVDSAAARVRALNPDVVVEPVHTLLDRESAAALLRGVDVVVDCTDTFEARYAVNAAALQCGTPVVHASVFRYEGRLTVFAPGRGPCYRCIHPVQPPADVAPACDIAGVLGVVPGVIGALQATETLKLLLNIGTPLIGRMLLWDALTAQFDEVAVAQDPKCDACGA